MPGLRGTIGLLSEHFHPPHFNKIMYRKFVLERSDLTNADIFT